MKRTILAMVMVAMTIIFVLEISMEQMFVSRRRATTQTMADVEEAVEVVESEEPPEVYALFGVDTQEGDAGRSDCILLISLEGNDLRMCSLARDTMVTISGTNTKTKLGHAYAMGGPELAVDTINENYDLNITKYASVNFSQMAEIVELMGGVEVSLSQEEWNYLGFGDPYLGSKRLDGQEALTYCRIRSIDSDDMRTGRQRTVIASMLTALQKMPRAKLPELVVEGIKMCRTNLSLAELLHLGKSVLTEREAIQAESIAIPGDSVSAWGGICDDGVWYYVYDLERASEVVKEFFYGEEAQTVDGEM